MTPSPAPPPSISVSVTPVSGTVILGNTQAFAATVTHKGDKTVAWSVNGVPGGNATIGTITAAGVYTAPADLPVPVAVQVMVTSRADSTKSGAANLMIVSNISLAITPTSASVELGASQQFHVRIASSGHPNTAVHWSVSGAACPGACGTVDVNGNYTAPQILPQPANLSLTAQSVADATRQASVPVNITSNFLFLLSALSSVSTGASVAITATLTPVPGSHPNDVVVWALSGAGRIVPANSLSLPTTPPGVTGIFGSHVVAVDATSGAVIGATFGGWSCAAPGPPQFDGSYGIDRLPVGRSYTVYAEALNGVIDPSQISNATATLCRNSTTDPGWPPLQGCVVPEVNISFTTRTRLGP